MSLGDTIAAIATAPGRGGVAIVRVSGPDAFQVAERLTGRAPTPRRVSLESVDSNSILIDTAVVLAFKGPHSYTGEDVVEFQCHGGTITPRRVLEACLASGARLAHRGEFTERAFLNGRLSYEAAASVLDLVDAKTDRAADAALKGATGETRREMKSLYEALVGLSSTVEHALDVSEDDLPDGFCEDIASSVKSLAECLDDAIRRAREGKILRDGALVVIAGPPNAGKSSLLNALLGESRAIVSATPGTTRDSIEEWLDIDGWPVRLVDTAGIREASDEIESEGVARARELVEKADIVVRLCPADGDLAGGTDGTCGTGVAIDVLSKCDLPHTAFPIPNSPLSVSAKTGEGLDALRRAIVAALELKAASPSDADGALGRDAASLVEARALLVQGNLTDVPLSDLPKPDIVLLANGIRAAAERVGEAIGATYSADMLDALFSRFCVGK